MWGSFFMRKSCGGGGGCQIRTKMTSRHMKETEKITQGVEKVNRRKFVMALLSLVNTLLGK